jgi:DNA-binding CsgD family transcriptional regulator
MVHYMPDTINYSLFLKFIDNYSGQGFKEINNQDPFMGRMNKTLNDSNQFLFVADLIKLQILHVSPQIFTLLGIEPEKVEPGILLSNNHPEDIPRLTRGFNIELSKAREIFMNKTGTYLLSSTFRKKKADGAYMHCLTQVYLFYGKSPDETVYALEVNTPVAGFSEIQNGHYHWYSGNDLINFRYPDKVLLQMGSAFSDREIEILNHIQKGLKTKEIAQILFLSPDTISTHRRNILKKAGKVTMSQIIFKLNNSGII